jgi:hypothetical protein
MWGGVLSNDGSIDLPFQQPSQTVLPARSQDDLSASRLEGLLQHHPYIRVVAPSMPISDLVDCERVCQLGPWTDQAFRSEPLSPTEAIKGMAFREARIAGFEAPGNAQNDPRRIMIGGAGKGWGG